MFIDTAADKAAESQALRNKKVMSPSVGSNVTSNQLGPVRAIIIAGVAAFALGLLSAFVAKAISPNINAPMASSGSVSSTM